MKDFLKFQLPPVLWGVLIYFFSHINLVFPQVEIPAGIDKISHALVYFVLCWLVRRAFYFQHLFFTLRRSSFFGGFLFSVAYGLLDEYHQYLLPGRPADFYNVVAATGGALLYVAAAWLMRHSHGQEEGDTEG